MGIGCDPRSTPAKGAVFHPTSSERGTSGHHDVLLCGPG